MSYGCLLSHLPANDDEVQRKVVESKVYEELVDYVQGRALNERIADLASVAIANFSTYGMLPRFILFSCCSWHAYPIGDPRACEKV